MEVLLGGVITIVTAIAVTVIVEGLRGPSLDIVVDPYFDISPRGQFARDWRSLRVAVCNRSLDPPLNWLVRLTAQQCRADLIFLRENGTEIFEKPSIGRWADTPEPIVGWTASTANSPSQPILLNGYQLESAVDIAPGEREVLDIAVRVQGEADCYCWNNESYMQGNWRNPDRKFGKGIFYVRVTVKSSGKKTVRHFRITNDNDSLQSFLLDPAKQMDAAHK